jgi:hypothetical protein
MTSNIKKPSLLVLCGTSLTRPFTNVLVTFALGKGRIEFANHLAPLQVVDLIKSDNCIEVTGVTHDATLIGVLTTLSAKGRINSLIDVQQWDDEIEFSYLFSELRLALNAFTCAPTFRDWINPEFVFDSMDNQIRIWRSNNRETERKYRIRKPMTRLSLKEAESNVRKAIKIWRS